MCRLCGRHTPYLQTAHAHWLLLVVAQQHFVQLVGWCIVFNVVVAQRLEMQFVSEVHRLPRRRGWSLNVWHAHSSIKKTTAATTPITPTQTCFAHNSLQFQLCTLWQFDVFHCDELRGVAAATNMTPPILAQWNAPSTCIPFV